MWCIGVPRSSFPKTLRQFQLRFASEEVCQRKHTLRYRNLLVRQMVQMKNKISTLLRKAGISYNKQRLHKASYFQQSWL
jgi:transposase